MELKKREDYTIEEFYNVILTNFSKSMIKDLLIRLKPELREGLEHESKMTKKELIKIMKELNPSLKKLWKIRDFLWADNMASLKEDIKEIRNGLSELRKN